MIRIRTPSRLHFGLFSVPSAQSGPWLNGEGKATIPRRHFGSVGLMIEKPGIELTVASANTWSVEGQLGERALAFAQTYCNAALVREAFHIRIESAAPEHVGLGTGTQLAIAVGLAISSLMEIPGGCREIAKKLGRGRRSALGIYGADFGGFLVDGGKLNDKEIAPLLHREDFPEEWSILLVTPRGLQGTHGRREIDAFNVLAKHEIDDRATDVLCRLVLLGMLPAMVEQDLPTFGEALYDFNRRAGEMYLPVQGSVYAHPRVEQLVAKLRSAGVKGAGQSSWGPTVFGVVSAESANELADWIGRDDDVDIIVTRANDRGAWLSNED